jgi:O-antigen ligase
MFLRIFNFRINWLERFLYQIKRDNILSGRDLLYTDAYNVFTGNPFIGRGVGFFEISHNGQYPHNFVLQLLAETGIVFTSFTLVVILVGLLYVIKNSEYKNRIDFMRYFFILSIPRLFISSTYWQLQFFWLYVFLCLILIKQLLYKKNKNWN